MPTDAVCAETAAGRRAGAEAEEASAMRAGALRDELARCKTSQRAHGDRALQLQAQAD